MATTKEHEANLSAPQVKAKQDDLTVTHQADAEEVAKEEFQKIVDFQKEVIPVVKVALIKQFPKKVNISETATVDTYDGDAFIDQATYYFENDDVNNPKVVFLVDKEDKKEMKALRKELEEKLGEKVLFKKTKHNPKVLRDMTEEVAKYVATIVGEGKKSTVGYNSKEEAIKIEAKLTDEQIADLKHKFGADILNITNEEPQIELLSF